MAKFCLHISINKKFYPFSESDRDLCSKTRKDMTDGLSIVFLRFVLWAKLLSEFHQISVNQSLELMRASSILIQYAKIYQPDCQQDGSISICKNSRLDITDLPILGTWSSLFTTKQDQNAEWRASKALEIKR